MRIRKMAKMLGRRGGLSRARRLPSRRRAEIARMGGRARAESLRATEAVRSNFDYLASMYRLHRPPHVSVDFTCDGPLPGVYGRETKD